MRESLRSDATTVTHERITSLKQRFSAWIAGYYARPQPRVLNHIPQDEPHEQLRMLSSRLQALREDQADRIACELHDQLGQILTGLKMDVAWLRRRLSSDQDMLVEKTRAMDDLIDEAIRSVRQIAGDLRPLVLDNFGLVVAIQCQLEELEARTNIQCTMACNVEEVVLCREDSTAVFRIFQEGLTNIARHADATRIDVSLEERNGLLILHVSDNGCGITLDELRSPSSIGIFSMRERARLISGTLRIQGEPGKGTTVVLQLPLRPA